MTTSNYESPPPVVSTGRGGQGNIGRDPTVYTDGGIVRKGAIGVSEKEEYSTGRGGAGNIGSPAVDAVPDKHAPVESIELVPAVNQLPEPAVDEGFHTGRGGGGNFHHPSSPAQQHQHHLFHHNHHNHHDSHESSTTINDHGGVKVETGPAGHPTDGLTADQHHKDSLGSRILDKLGLRHSASPSPPSAVDRGAEK